MLDRTIANVTAWLAVWDDVVFDGSDAVPDADSATI
jgi:hypothetical protein